MDLKGDTRIAAPRAAVWAALNDPAVLARCIDGVESLSRTEDNRFEGTLNARVGPVRAKFTGAVTLSDLDPPNGYTIAGEGKGGVAGFARGSARVRLDDAEGGGTLLAYEATSNVGGKLAQLGSRMIEGVARGYADSFFAGLKAELERPAETPTVGLESGPSEAAASLAAVEIAAAAPEVFAAPGRARVSPAIWAVLAVAALLIVALMFK